MGVYICVGPLVWSDTDMIFDTEKLLEILPLGGSLASLSDQEYSFLINVSRADKTTCLPNFVKGQKALKDA